jgi:hypothetical protein
MGAPAAAHCYFDVDRLPFPDIQAAVHSNAGLIFDLDQYLDGM